MLVLVFTVGGVVAGLSVLGAALAIVCLVDPALEDIRRSQGP